jgi:adenylate kinase family enzyme
MDQGDLVPDDVTIKMLQAEVDNNPDSAGFLFDGFQLQHKGLRFFSFKKRKYYSYNCIRSR